MCDGGCDGTQLPSGAAGADGLNAFTVLTAGFTQPSVGSNVTIAVSASGQYTAIWAVAGQTIYIAGGGYYEVISVGATNAMTVKNLGYSGNASPTSTVTSGGKVSPAGPIGASGSAGSNGSNGADGANGTTVIDTDVTDITTAQTSYASANKTVTIPADTWETVDDTVDLEMLVVSDTANAICGVQVLLDGNVLDLKGVSGLFTDVLFNGGGGYAGARIKVSLVMSASGSITPITSYDVMGTTFSTYSTPYVGADKVFASQSARGAATTGLTFSSTNDIVVKMKTDTGNIKMFYYQLTSKKK